MTIRYIIGRAGSGTDRRAIEEIGRELQKDSVQRLFLLVPEQYTLQAERNLIAQLNLPGIMRAEVLSFNRLLYRVLNETGGKNKVLINEQGRNMVIKKVINSVAGDLKVYQKASRQQGFIDEIAGLLASFKQYDIEPEALSATLELINQQGLRLKVQDIALIYAAYTEYMSNHYLDMEDQLNLFIEKLDESKLLINSLIWLDKFDYFPPQNLRIIEKLMLQAQEMTICLTGDRNPGRDKDIFRSSRYCYERIHALAKQHGLKEELFEPIYGIKGSLSPRPACLKHLEQEFYAYPQQVYNAETNQIEIFAAANIYSEAEHIATRIIRMVQERGWRWRDIVVLGNDLDTYGPIISRVFSEYRIPYFLDAKSSIDNHPLVKMIISTLAVINRGYRPEDVFMLIKCGFTDLTLDEGEEMENYMLAYGIRGNLCLEDFNRGQNEIAPEQLATLNSLRHKLFAPLQKLERLLQGKKTGRELCQALFLYLQNLNIETKLQEWSNQLRGNGLFEYALQNGQIWNIIIHTFDQLVEILGDQTIHPKEFANLLETGLQSFSVGIIPTTVDQVMVGQVRRSKNHTYKAVLIMGVNDDVLPSGKTNQIIFSEEEKKFLQTCQMDLDWDQQTQNLKEQFDIYLAFNQAEEFLCLSYAIADQEGKALRPSLLINQMKILFPQLTTHSDLIRSTEIELEQLVTPTGSYKYLAEKLRLHLDGEVINDFWWDVYDWYDKHPQWEKRRHDLLDALFYQNQISTNEQSGAGKLYKTPFNSSVSRLEQFAACPFAHFVRFGLRPQERKQFTVGIPDIGILLHEGLAAFSAELSKQGIDWRNIDRPICEELVDKIMAEQLAVHNNGIMMSSYRNQYLSKRLQRITRRAVWTLTEHIQRGDFQPYLYEARFGNGGVFPPLKVELNEQQSFFLEGRIDRIDIIEVEDHTYCKIIDYKSSERQISLAELYFGLNLQLFVYLLAVLNSNAQENNTNLISKPYYTAGLFYFQIDDPLIAAADMEAEDIAAAIRKKLRMKGLVLKDVALVRSMDRDLQGESDILPLGIKNNGEFSARSSVLDHEEFDLLLHYLQDLLRELGEQMIKGQILIEPVKTEKGSACDYCPYHAICQFDKRFAANHYKQLKLENDAIILDKIKKLQEDNVYD